MCWTSRSRPVSQPADGGAVADARDLVRQESQFIVATLSPIIMACPDSIIYQLSDQGMEVVEYTETEHFSVAKGYLENHRRMLDLLLAD